MNEQEESDIQKKVDIFYDFFEKENLYELSYKNYLSYKERIEKAGFVFGKKNFVRSPLEYAFALILEKLGLKFFTQRRVGDRAFDFYLPDLKVLIELDGKNYHLVSLDNFDGNKIFYPHHGQCKKCGEFNHLDKQVVEKMVQDYEKSREPAKYGVRFIKFFSEEIWTHKYNEKPKLNKGVTSFMAQEIIDMVYSPSDNWIKARLLKYIERERN